jgi:hypothetical protein
MLVFCAAVRAPSPQIERECFGICPVVLDLAGTSRMEIKNIGKGKRAGDDRECQILEKSVLKSLVFSTVFTIKQGECQGATLRRLKDGKALAAIHKWTRQVFARNPQKKAQTNRGPRVSKLEQIHVSNTSLVFSSGSSTAAPQDRRRTPIPRAKKSSGCERAMPLWAWSCPRRPPASSCAHRGVKSPSLLIHFPILPGARHDPSADAQVAPRQRLRRMRQRNPVKCPPRGARAARLVRHHWRSTSLVPMCCWREALPAGRSTAAKGWADPTCANWR